ncbi:uncharacterized protein K444DRAFT_612387 [Hyaloscypha bicolor E]|uniref:Uncharacterized protein n=1 Tax=Hyaloscypha bicolor E TaxID=1095630 RepID=A0A2J6TCA4_9HELO|nr:uncharacterized protein K444DRAFT_612387 [Hyaloscypha bicolor E]PMD60660.1 hypothetical protein K444DRAFT_612387 [Hyaloscypha bicolor E]
MAVAGIRSGKSFRQALQTLWTEDDIESLRKRLDGYRQHLIVNILVLLKSKMTQPRANKPKLWRNLTESIAQSIAVFAC